MNHAVESYVGELEELRELKKTLTANLNPLAKKIFDANLRVGWWSEEDIAALMFKSPKGKFNRDTATLLASKIALCHSELSEALEGMRKGLMDDHLPHRSMIEVELADSIIRILDICGFLGLDIGGAVSEKFEYNQRRSDHKLSNREAAGGKTI
jgi:NTP pyrophosphatase (non-canonical NTP hydrolase)